MPDHPSASDARAARFWDRFAARYARMRIADPAVYEEKLNRIRARLTPESEVLEIGCGTGGTALSLASSAGHVRATDVSAEMIALAHARTEPDGSHPGVEGVTFAVAGLNELDPADRRYDAVVAMNVIHLLDDRDTALRRMHALLKPGGILAASTFCVADILPRLKVLIPLGKAVGLLPNIQIFSAERLRASLTAAGFEIVEDWHPGPRKALFQIARRPEA